MTDRVTLLAGYFPFYIIIPRVTAGKTKENFNFSGRDYDTSIQFTILRKFGNICGEGGPQIADIRLSDIRCHIRCHIRGPVAAGVRGRLEFQFLKVKSRSFTQGDVPDFVSNNRAGRD